MNLFLASTIEESIDVLIREYALDPLATPAVYIPTAQNCSHPPPKLEDRGSYQCLIQRKFPVTVCEIDKDSDESIHYKLSQAKIIVVGGGNTYFLLYHMKRSCFAQLIPTLLAKEVIYVGSSAGSCVCSPNISYVAEQDDPSQAPKLTDYTGLNLVDFDVYPHCIEPYYEQQYSQNYIYNALKSSSKKIFLKDSQAVVVSGSTYRIVS